MLGVILGDVIVGFGGKPVKDQKDLFAALDTCRPGDEVELCVSRGGVERTVRAVLQERGGRQATFE
jgi:S1-C subfamily serine protease